MLFIFATPSLLLLKNTMLVSTHDKKNHKYAALEGESRNKTFTIELQKLKTAEGISHCFNTRGSIAKSTYRTAYMVVRAGKHSDTEIKWVILFN